MNEWPDDVRWIQRLDNFKRARQQIESALHLGRQRALSELEQQGLIQAFEYTHELAWKVMKDYLGQVGGIKLIGSRDTTREAFAQELISNGDAWMDMILSRNLTSHTYNLDVATQLAKKIGDVYAPLFDLFEQTMTSFKSGLNS